MDWLERFDGPVTAAAPVPELRAVTAIPNGLYTLTFPDGSHKTFKVHRQRETAKFAPGTRIISLLIGPSNTDDFERFGFVNEEGIKVWKSFRRRGESSPETAYERYARLVWALATGGEIEGYELLVSKRCLICNRELTTPRAVERSIGDHCWKKYFGG